MSDNVDDQPFVRDAARAQGEALLLRQLPTVERIVAALARRHHLRPAEADEFAATVRLRLVEHDYEILRKFQGRSTIQTYLTIVVQRLFLDFRTARWGRWRPSAEARRFGPAGELYERLTVRDGLSFEEACETMRVTYGLAVTPESLDAIAAKLPSRPRRQIVGEDLLESVPDARVADPAEALLRGDREQAGARARQALERVLGDLEPQDRLVIRLRFEDGMKMADIARLLRVPAKPLYGRVERLLAGIRERLEAMGILPAEVADSLCAPAIADEDS